MSVEVVAAPEFKKWRTMAAEYLKETEPEYLLLRFSKSLEGYIVQFVEGLPYEYVIDELRRSQLVPEPMGAWEYSAEPLLKVLPHIRNANLNLEVYCYGDPFYNQESMKVLLEAASLTLRGTITGQIDTEKWRKLLKKEKGYRKEALRRETDSVIIQASKHEESVCVTNSNTIYVVSELKEEGFEVRQKNIGFPCPPTPLEILRKEIEDEPEISDERIEELVHSHIKYIREYVLLSKDLDQANIPTNFLL